MLKTAGTSGPQLTLGKKYSGRHFDVEERAAGESILRPVWLVRDTAPAASGARKHAAAVVWSSARKSRPSNAT